MTKTFVKFLALSIFIASNASAQSAQPVPGCDGDQEEVTLECPEKFDGEPTIQPRFVTSINPSSSGEDVCRYTFNGCNLIGVLACSAIDQTLSDSKGETCRYIAPWNLEWFPEEIRDFIDTLVGGRFEEPCKGSENYVPKIFQELCDFIIKHAQMPNPEELELFYPRNGKITCCKGDNRGSSSRTNTSSGPQYDQY